MPDDPEQQSTSPSGKTENGKPAPAKIDRSRPRYALPTDRIAFQRQLDLLRAFAVVSGSSRKTVTIQDVAQAMGMTTSTLSLANGFFLESGLLTRSDRLFMPCDELFAYNSACQWEQEDAGTKLQPVIEQTWFAKALLPRLSLKPIDEGLAVQILAENAVASTSYKGQIKTLIEYLIAAGLVIRDGSLLRGNKRLGASAPAIDLEELPTMGDQPSPRFTQPTPASHPVLSPGIPAGIHYNFSIDLEFSELSSWSPERITAFFGGLAQMLAAKNSESKGEDR